MSIDVEGTEDVVAAFRELPDAIREVIGEKIETTAGIIHSEARRRVPYDDGDLDRDIKIKLSPRKQYARVGNDLFYAPFQELGTLRSPAQPYLYPAFRAGARYLRREMRGWGNEVGAQIRGRARRRRRPRNPQK